MSFSRARSLIYYAGERYGNRGGCGGARNVLCEAVERHKASMLVSGSHGYGAMKRYIYK